MENKETRKIEFKKLTPSDNTKMEGYNQALDFVFQEDNEDVLNVALAGNFGSGKSSVIRTYES